MKIDVNERQLIPSDSTAAAQSRAFSHLHRNATCVNPEPIELQSSSRGFITSSRTSSIHRFTNLPFLRFILMFVFRAEVVRFLTFDAHKVLLFSDYRWKWNSGWVRMVLLIAIKRRLAFQTGLSGAYPALNEREDLSITVPNIVNVFIPGLSPFSHIGNWSITTEDGSISTKMLTISLFRNLIGFGAGLRIEIVAGWISSSCYSFLRIWGYLIFWCLTCAISRAGWWPSDPAENLTACFEIYFANRTIN